MNVVDSCGWLEYLSDGANAEFFAAPLEDVENLVVPTISVFEVFKRLLADRGEGAALAAMAQMHEGTIVDLDASLAADAARLSVKHKIPLADAVILASAQSHRATLWTQDADFEGLPNVRYIERRT